MSVVIKPRATESRAGADHGAKSAPSVSKVALSSLGRSYITPDSSVSPGLLPKSAPESYNDGHDSGDETDDLYMDGIDDDEDCGPRAAGNGPKDDDQADASAEDDPAIAPTTLTKAYLPALFMQHGPCAIRQITQHLALNNPTFGALGQGKQRRLVVRALENGKGSVFEKVGWGRWNAIERNSPGQFTPEAPPVGKDDSLLTARLRSSGVPGMPQRGVDSYPPPSSLPAHQEFMFSPSMSIHEVTGDHREDDADIDPLDLDMDDDSATDEEDWKSMGAEALRTRASPAIGSYQGSLAGSYGGSPRSSGPYTIRRKSSAGVYQMKSPAMHPYSGVPFSKSPGFSRTSFPKSSSYLKSSPMAMSRTSSFAAVREVKVSDTAERESRKHDRSRGSGGADAEAVEALFMLSGSYDDRIDK